jgi:hypothetical protein
LRMEAAALTARINALEAAAAKLKDDDEEPAPTQGWAADLRRRLLEGIELCASEVYGDEDKIPDVVHTLMVALCTLGCLDRDLQKPRRLRAARRRRCDRGAGRAESAGGAMSTAADVLSTKRDGDRPSLEEALSEADSFMQDVLRNARIAARILEEDLGPVGVDVDPEVVLRAIRLLWRIRCDAISARGELRHAGKTREIIRQVKQEKAPDGPEEPPAEP